MKNTPLLLVLAVLVCTPVPSTATAVLGSQLEPAPQGGLPSIAGEPARAPTPPETERQTPPARAPQSPTAPARPTEERQSTPERQPAGERERGPAPAERPNPQIPTRNVKVDIAITERQGSTAPLRKAVSLVVADRRKGSVRTSVAGPPPEQLLLNVDADVFVTQENRILLQLRFLYATPSDATPPRSNSMIQEDIHVLLTPGATLAISQSADASGERTVTVEVKAEILK